MNLVSELQREIKGLVSNQDPDLQDAILGRFN